MIARLLSDMLARLFGPCPFWHRTVDRIRRHENQRIVYECALCGRDAGEALKDQYRAEPVEPVKAEVDRDDWWRKRA